MTRDALATSGATPCGDLRSVVRDAVPDLNVIAAPEMAAQSETQASPAGK
jgi:hypothetical protein